IGTKLYLLSSFWAMILTIKAMTSAKIEMFIDANHKGSPQVTLPRVSKGVQFNIRHIYKANDTYDSSFSHATNCEEATSQPPNCNVMSPNHDSVLQKYVV